MAKKRIDLCLILDSLTELQEVKSLDAGQKELVREAYKRLDQLEHEAALEDWWIELDVDEELDLTEEDEYDYDDVSL